MAEAAAVAAVTAAVTAGKRNLKNKRKTGAFMAPVFFFRQKRDSYGACLRNAECGTRNDELQFLRLEFIVPRSSFIVQDTLHN
ncbi:MAG TPA: hypothetical protein VF721_08390, partial [Pyrinomonadaceae bacterium]